MVNTFINLISGFLKQSAQDSITWVLTIFQWLGVLGNVILEMPDVKSGILYTQEVALTLLALKIAYESYMIYILRQQGEPTSDPTNVLIGAVRAGSVISVMPWLIKYLYGYGMTMAFEVKGLPGTAPTPDNNTFTLILNLLNQVGTAVMFIAIAILFAIIMLLVVLIQSFIRSAELAVAAWMGSFMALGLTSKESQAWTGWWQDTLSICLASALQLALLKFSFFTLTPIEVNFNGQMIMLPAVVNLLLFISALWVTYKSPTILKEKLHATGIGRAGGAAGQALLTRLIMRK